MSYNELEKVEFRFPMVAPDMEAFSTEELDEERDGLSPNLPRVKIPGGGGLTFEMPGDDPEHPVMEPTLRGVIVHSHTMNAYWPPEADNNDPPTCSALTGMFGVGVPGGACVTCPNNRFGSGEKGKSKACKNMRVLYLLQEGEYMPVQLNLPPTSLRAYDQFYTTAFGMRRRGICGSVVELGLKRATSDGTTFSVVTFQLVGDLEGENLLAAKQYASAFREQIKTSLEERATRDAMEHESLPGEGDYGEERFDVGTDKVLAGSGLPD